MAWRAAVAGLEVATAGCAALNLAYFLHRLALPCETSLSRRVAASVLALLSLGTLVENVFVLATVLAEGDASTFASGGWVLVTALSSAGTVSVSALVLRRIGGS